MNWPFLLRPMWKGPVCSMWMFGAKPYRANLFTWELSSNFDETVSPRQVNDLFEREFPTAVKRLRDGGGSYSLWPLVSFNAAEGRLSRFLVAFTERDAHRGRLRRLPSQIWLYSVADAAAANIPDREYNGSFWFHMLVGGILYMLVFFEGRFCYWSEERFDFPSKECSGSLQERLARFRRFLVEDPLFSRDSIIEISGDRGDYDDSLRQAFFRRASRDPFWRHLSLTERTEKKIEATAKKEILIILGGVLLLFLLGYNLAGTFLFDDLDVARFDALPEQLLPAPEIVNAEKIPTDDVDFFHGLQDQTAACNMPEFRLKGIVAEKLAVISISEKSKVLRPGDSLGSFSLFEIGKDYVRLACLDSVLERRTD